MTAADVVVLGAGPAGTAAAFRLARAGHRVVVCEAAASPGGLAASFTFAGMRVDHGSHRLHPATPPDILAVLRALPGVDLQWRPRNGRVHLEGRWVGFPLRAVELARRLPPRLTAAAARDLVATPLRRGRAGPPSPDASFAEILGPALGPALCERFYFPYARKLWGLAPQELDGEQARRRVSLRSPAGVLGRALRPRRSGFYYPATGFGTLWEALAAAATAAGADLRLATPAEGIRLSTTGAEVDTPAGTVRAGQVWSTLPLPRLVGLLEPAAPPAVQAAAASLRTRAMVLVYLALEVPRWTPYDAHYVPDADCPISRLSEPKGYRDGPDPPGKTVVCAELPCAVGDDLWSRDDRELAATVVAGIQRLGLPPVTPHEVLVRRHPAVYPVYRRGFARDFSRVDGWLSEQPRLLTFGRHGLFAHDNSHHALAMAWAAADALDRHAQVDRQRWRQARATFATHVVED